MTTQEHNEMVRTAMEAASAGRGYAAVYYANETVHAAIGTRLGRNARIFPRAVCSPNSPLQFASLVHHPHTAVVTCQRCIAGLHRRGVIG